MLRRGKNDTGNLRYTTLRQVEISDRMTPHLSRPIHSLAQWQQDMLKLDFKTKDFKRRFKTSCFTCGRQQSKDRALFFYELNHPKNAVY